MCIWLADELKHAALSKKKNNQNKQTNKNQQKTKNQEQARRNTT